MQFLYPSFLWGLLAICLPVFIHLLQMRRPQRVLFTNTGFIKAVQLTTIRRRRLQELLVLLLRILAVTFLVIAFCQPFIPAKENNNGFGGQGIGVVLDNTLSMQAPALQQGNLLQQSVLGAQALGRAYGNTRHFELLAQGGGKLTGTAYKLKLNELQVASGKVAWDKPTVYQNLLGTTSQLLYVFSDFQKSIAGKAFLKELPASGIVLVPQIGRSVGNIYVDSVWLDDAFVRTRTNLGLHVRLRNGGAEPVADCPVKVLLGQRQAAAFRVSIAPAEMHTTVVQVQLADATLALGRVVTEDVPVTFDNTYYFTLQPASTIRILEIGAAPLAQQAYANEALFAYSFAKPRELNYNKLQRADMVLVSELSQVDSGLRQALAQVTKRGGSVVVVPASKNLDRESYHQLFRALGLGGEQWASQTGSSPVLQEVALPNRNTPFFKDVFGAQPRQVVMPRAAPVLSWRQNGLDILRLRDGDSYLTEFKSDKGKAFVFAAPFERAYSDFVVHALFVPVLYRLAMLSYDSNQRLAYRLTAPLVSLAVPRAGSSQLARDEEKAAVHLVRDSAVFVPTQRLQGEKLQLAIPAEMSTPGFYKVEQQGKTIATLAFNADRHESELATYSVAELRELIGPNQPNVRVLDSGQPEAVARYQAEQTGHSLWRYCLVLALACLLAEGMLLRFGRPKPTVGQPAVAA